MNKRGFWLFFVLFLGIILFVFRSLIFNISSNLYSWLDLPYVIWVMYQGIEKISNLNFANFGTTNAFYPINDSYFFSDLLLSQAILAYPFSIFIKNPILVVNIVFLVTLALNYVFLFLFWSIWFKKNWQCFIASIVFIFSPFFHSQLGHFQMMSYWSFFASLYFFLRKDGLNIKDSIASGVFLVLQFLSSVYLSVFLIFSLCLSVLIKFIQQIKFDKVKSLFIVFFVFIIGAGFFIYNYIQVKKHYSFIRDYGEYVTYSAHLSDYFFTTGIDSISNSLSIVKKWNSFDKHFIGERASFPGMIITIVFVLYLLYLIKNKNFVRIGIKLDRLDLFFMCLIIIGLFFSFGPRLSFNGVYSGIPTPYTFLIKYVPFFDSVRGLARWSFIFYLGLSYFFVKYIENKKIWLAVILFMLFLLECLPINLKTSEENYLDNKTDYILKSECISHGKHKVLLEIPTTHLMVSKGVYIGLNYISKRQLASIYHGCLLVNGYSGYEPPSQTAYYNNIENYLSSKKSDELLKSLQDRNVNFLRISPDLISDKEKLNYINTIENLVNKSKIIKVADFLYKVQY